MLRVRAGLFALALEAAAQAGPALAQTADGPCELPVWVQTRLVSPREGMKANIEASNAELPLALAENLRKFASYLGNAK